MALLFMDGFDAGDYAVKYDGTGKLTASSVTRFGYGYSGLLSSSSGYAPYANKYFSGSQTIWIGFAYKGNNSDDYFLSTYGDGGVTNHINIRHINATTVGIFGEQLSLAELRTQVILFGVITSWERISQTWVDGLNYT